MPTTTCLVGSLRAAQTLSVSSCSIRAPVGQTAMHWPQYTQAVSPRGMSKAEPMWVLIAAVVGADDGGVLVALADGNAAAAQDALGIVAHEVGSRKSSISGSSVVVAAEAVLIHAVLVGTGPAARS